MQGLLAFLLVLLFALPAWGNGETCIFDATVTWTSVGQDIDTVGGDCTESSADLFVVPMGVVVTIGGDITLTGAGNITVQSGGSLVFDVDTDGEADYKVTVASGNITFDSGSTGTTCPPASADDLDCYQLTVTF